MKTKILPVLAGFLFLANFTNAQSGRIDPSFGNNGHTYVNAEGYYQYNFTDCRAMLINPNTGKIIAGANSRSTASGNKFYQNLIQLKTNGKIDSPYAVNGVVSYDPGYALNFTNSGFQAMAFRNGKTVFVSNFDQNNPPTIFISRFNANGTIDGTFGTNGNVVLTYTNTGTMADVKASDITMQPDGKILIAGNYTNSESFPNTNIILWRLNANGTFDNTFGNNGTLDLRNFIYGWNTNAAKVLVQSNGRILIGGYSNFYNGYPQFTVLRLLSNGTADNSFGKYLAGYSIQTFPGSVSSVCESMAIQSDGKIVAAGNNNTTHTSDAWCFMRLNKNGTLDTSFNKKGKLLIESIQQGPVNALAIAPNGKIAAAGWGVYFHNNTINYNIGTILQVNANGKTDSTFGIDGVVSDSAVAGFKGMAIDANGNIVAAGNSFFNGTTVLIAARYLTSPTINLVETRVADAASMQAAFVTVPASLYPNPVHTDAMLSYTLDKNEAVSVFLYDMNGRFIQTFMNNITMTAGVQKQSLHFASSVLPGNYILKIQTGTKTAGIKIIKQ